MTPPTRSVTEVGPGDYVKIHGDWKQILTNTAFRADAVPRTWTVTTTDGESYEMFAIDAYAKAGEVRQPTFVCPRCSSESGHPEDIANGYCGRCHEFTGEDHDIIFVWNEHDSFIIEVQAAAEALGMRARDALGLLVGMGLQYAVEMGLIAERASTPMDTAELFRRLATGILRGP